MIKIKTEMRKFLWIVQLSPKKLRTLKNNQDPENNQDRKNPGPENNQ